MKKLLLMFVGIVCSLMAMAAEQTASFSLVSFTAGNPASITSSDNTDVSLSIGRSDNSSNVSADGKSRGFRVQANRFFTVTVPEGKYIKKVEFTSNSQGNPDSGTVGIWSVTGESSTWNLGGKAATYTWTNGGSNLSNPMTFKQTAAAGDAYIASVKVYYDNAPTVEDKAPTIKTQPTNATTVTDVATTLSVVAEGSPTPAYQWYSCDDADKTNAQKIEDATGSSYNFTTSTAGTYYFYVVAENKVDKATSNVVSVTVNQAYVMTFSKGETGALGTVNPAIRSNGELKVTTPKYNNALFVEGKTFSHWTDGVNEYLPNTEYTLSSNVTVTPVFEANVKTLNDVRDETTVQFIKSTSTAATYQSSEKNAVVEQVDINGQKTDVALIVQNGKFDLQPAGPRAQTNQNTVVSIPVTKGATVVIDIYDNNSTKTHNCTINGESVASYLDGSSTTTVRKMTYVYNGEEAYIDYVVNAGNMYANCINVTYPNQSGISTKPTVTFSMKTAATGNVSVDANADHVALPAAANLTANGGSVTVSNGQSSAKSLVTNRGFSMTNGNTFFTVTLDAPLKAGDVITATMSEASRGLKFATTDNYSTDYPGEASATTAFSYTVTEEDGICGATTFNVFRATSNTTYFNDFKITRPATIAEPTLNAAGFTTFSSAYPVKISGAKVYTATLDLSNDPGVIYATEIESGEVPAGNGVILVGEAGAKATASYKADAAAIENANHLKATTTAEDDVVEIEGALVLSGSTFKRYTGAAFTAGKAYFPYNVNNAKTAFSIVFSDQEEATAADAVEAETVKAVAPVKYINANGQIIIGNFNVAGQQVK